MQAVLDIRLDDLLAGPIVARVIVHKAREVPLEFMPLHIRIAERHKYRCSVY